MRIYFHFLYLSILTVVWCGFYYWQTTKTNGWWKNGHSLGAVNLAQVMYANEGCFEEIKKKHSDYPSLQGDKYYGRSYQVMKLLKNTMKEVSALDEKKILAYRTDYSQFLIAQVDNDETTVDAIKNAISPEEVNEESGTQPLPVHKEIILDELILRLALSSTFTQFYFMTRTSSCGGYIADRFFPGLLLHSNYYVVGEKIDIPVAMCGYKSPPPSFQIISTGLPPFGDGFIGLDPTIQTPGIHRFPCLIRYQDFHTGAVVEIQDTILLKIFPR